MDGPGATVLQCNDCGASSELEAGFVRGKKGKGKTTCLSCLQYDLVQSRSRNRRAAPVFIGISILLIFLLPEDSWIFFNVVLLYLCIYPSLIPHELGHALGALISGQKVLQITLGSGPLLFSRRWCGVKIEIRPWPTEGLLFKQHTRRSFIKLREFITVAAGPLANLALAWFIWFAFAETLEHTSPFSEPHPLLALFIANAFLGLTNLLPFYVRTGFGVLPSDGRQLLMLPFVSVEEKLKQQAIALGFLALHNNELAACKKLCAAGLADHPADPQLLTIKSILLCKQRNYRAARELTLTLLNNESLSALERALAQNNLAWFDYLSADPDLLEEADRLSATALRTIPWNLAVRSTRGAVLVATGHIEKAIGLLNDKRFIIESRDSRALVACSLAMAYALRGEAAKARATLEQASSLDPECVLLERARGIVDTTQAQPAIRRPQN